MKIKSNTSPIFMRRLKSSEEIEYSSVLKAGKAKVSHNNTAKDGRSILIVPFSSMPQCSEYNTGVGNLASEEGQKFADFAKKYWGINEVQILPIGQYHSHRGSIPIYSGTSMDLGNHVIYLKDFLDEKKLRQIVKNNNLQDRVNFSNIIEINSMSEKCLKELMQNMPDNLKSDFENYKKKCSETFERKCLYRAFREIYNTSNYKKWNDTDKNLFNEDIINPEIRDKRIEEVQNLKAETIEFYKFKNFLAEKSLEKAKRGLNAKGIKLNGDLMCGFSYDEVWARPKAFMEDLELAKWGLPVLDVNSKEAEDILKEKAALYSKWYDGFRVDASWTYITPNVINKKTKEISKLYNGEKFLNIINEEVKKVKGDDFDLNNITHEFAADPQNEFNIFSGSSLKTSVKDRVKIYTSDHLSNDWGSADNFIKRGWSDDKFIIGPTNHDSPKMSITEKQVKALSHILKIPETKLNTLPNFLKAKFAEPLRAKNNMIQFTDALGLNTQLNNNRDISLNWTAKIPENYEDIYFQSLIDGKAYNPMDALEKQFIAQGLDKREKKLFKKIVKYRKILENSNKTNQITKYVIGICSCGIFLLGIYKYYKYQNNKRKGI